MALPIPTLDDRRYQDLLDEALARVPVHNPEWTNFNKSDPGVTLLEVFAFMTETLLYRANRIPELHRRKFLSLLGLQLEPASPARGIVAFKNERGPLQSITLNGDLEVDAGNIPFRTELGLDVLPIEAQIYIKRQVLNPAPEVLAYYQQLYASSLAPNSGTQLSIYETVPLAPADETGVDIGRSTVDGAVWIALLARATDTDFNAVRQQLGGRTLSLGIVPSLVNATQKLPPGGRLGQPGSTLLDFAIPSVPASGLLPPDRVPRYISLDATSTVDILSQPGVVQISLPAAQQLRMWENLDPLEEGLDQFPPALQDSKIAQRVVTWLRIKSAAAANASLLWAGINAATVTQKAHVANELLPTATGEPDQTVPLSQSPVIPNSARVHVTFLGQTTDWTEVDDLASAGPEVPTPDLRQPPGAPAFVNRLTDVFTVDAQSGLIHFGDGLRGRRPPAGAILRADYDFGVGLAGNVNAGAISSSPVLPSGLTVTNPIRTWGGADAETVAQGEKQITSYLQHRDRLVNADDFKTIAQRTPGVNLGRVEVLPAFSPELAQSQPGDAAGAVTLLLIPSYDPVQPDAPMPDSTFIDAVCNYIDPRRLVTTEVFLRGPSYKQVWVAAGISVIAGQSIADVQSAVKAAVSSFLSPFRWPLFKPVSQLELVAVVARVAGVLQVNGLSLAEGTAAAAATVNMQGLELPRLMGVSVTIGGTADLDQIRGQSAVPSQGKFVPVPAAPVGC